MRNLLLAACAFALGLGCATSHDLRVNARVEPAPALPGRYTVDLTVDYGAAVSFPRQVAQVGQPEQLFMGERDAAGNYATGVGVDYVITPETAAFEVSRFDGGHVVEQRRLHLSLSR